MSRQAPSPTVLLSPEGISAQLQEKEKLAPFLAQMFAAGQSCAALVRMLKGWTVAATTAVLRGFRSDHVGPWAYGRALHQVKKLHEQHGVSPAEATRLILAQRLLEIAGDPETPPRELLQIKTALLREDQLHQGEARLQRELQLKTRGLDQRDQTIQLQLRRIEALEAKVQEAARLTENTELTEQDRISQIRAIFGR